MSELLWVAVPDGLASATTASLRVLVVPRLAAGSLADYTYLQDWPNALAEEISFSVHTRTSMGERTVTTAPQYVARARSPVWQAFFSGDAGLIDDYEPQSYPQPVVAPTTQAAANAAGTYRSVTRYAADATNSGVDATISSAVARWAAPEPDPPPSDDGPPVFGDADFHSTVSALREHPTVLADLGLVFELLVDVADLALGDPAAGRQLSVLCTDPPLLSVLVTSPWTRYDLSANDFRPAPNPGSNSGIRGGLLDLSSSVSLNVPGPLSGQDGVNPAPSDAAPVGWALATFDVDGAAGGLRQAGRDVVANPDTAATMPPLRSVGLALLRFNRQADFTARVEAAAANRSAATTDTVFGAEDLVLGYRVDIRREEDPWRSVCEREATYAVNGIAIGAAPDSPDGSVFEEGHVKAFTALKDADGALHADEMVLRWDGWSLAVPTPNLRGDTAGPAAAPGAPLPYQFTWFFAAPSAPGRLPALRFADRYQMRVRIADIAGGGLKLSDVDTDTAASITVSYRRHEPIQPPRLRDAGPYTPGAAIDRMVIRSGSSATSQQPLDDNVVDSRTMDKATASLQLIEQHRMLDGLSDQDSFTLALAAMRADAAGSGLADPVPDGVNAVVLPEPGGLTQPLSERASWPDWPALQPKTVQLHPLTDQPGPITIAWDPTNVTLTVGLAQAEQAIIEFSSTIPGNMAGHLAMTDYLDSPPISTDDTELGRNPVITPACQVVVVHAVRAPLAQPQWTQADGGVTRSPGDTFVVLNPTFTPADSGAGLNVASTARVDIAASWTDVDDTAAVAGATALPVTVAHLDSQPIALGAAPQMQIRHEFGDTKHRTVTYTLNAISRFREYFDQTEPDAAFETSQDQQPVDIPSSAVPPAPVVLGVVPAFQWQRTQPDNDRIEHTRATRRVRVEVARPWFATGDGEQLAVVLTPVDPSVSTTGDGTTRVGGDPLFGTPAVTVQPTPQWFPGGTPHQVSMPAAAAPLTVIAFDVTAGGDRWYADIEFAVPAVGGFYNPFVQLAVARYQKDSIPGQGLELSPIVTTGKIPLLPDRQVLLSRAGNQVTVTVTGTSPDPPNTLVAILETCGPGIDPESLDLIVDDPTVDDDVPAWRPVPDAAVARTAAGTIPPLTLIPTQGRLRVRLRETENIPGGGTDAPDLTQRNVFVDTIVIPSDWQPT